MVVGAHPGSIALCSGHADTCSALAKGFGTLLTPALVSSLAANLRTFPIQLNLERKGSSRPIAVAGTFQVERLVHAFERPWVEGGCTLKPVIDKRVSGRPCHSIWPGRAKAELKLSAVNRSSKAGWYRNF
jgi:hypothetical protein